MQNEASDKSRTTTELDDSTLDGVVGGTSNILGSGGGMPVGTGGGLPTVGGGGSGVKPGGSGDPFKGGPLGSSDPNSIHFPK